MNNIVLKIVNRTIFFIINFVNILYNRVEYGNYPNIRGILRINNNGNFVLGSSVYLISGQIFNPIGGENKLQIWVSKNAKLKIGSRVGIANSSIVVQNEVEIQDDVLIGSGCRIYDTDFHSLETVERRIGYKNPVTVLTEKVLIKKGAFVGAHSIILKGVNIGENSIIAAGSVVFKDVPDNQIWAGNPARCIGLIE